MESKPLTSNAEPERRTATATLDGGLPLGVVDRAAAGEIETRPSHVRRAFRIARFVPLIMLLMLTGGVIGLYFQPPGVRFVMGLLKLDPGGGTSAPIAVPAPRAGQPGATTPAAAIVAGLGKLLPEGDVVTIAAPFGAGDARVATIAVVEGQSVERGQLLATLDNEKALEAALAAARAAAASREAVLAQVRAATQASRSEAQAALARAETSAANAAREFERIDSLRRGGFAADQQFELRRTQRDETAREVERLRATLSRFAGDPDAQPDVLVAARGLDAARADLQRANADMEKAQVRAPIAGTVLSISARPGEKPGSQGIMHLGDLSRIKAEVEVHQSQIGKVAPGAAVTMTADALQAALNGTVSRIGLEIGRQALVDVTPAANTDARVVKVTVALDPESAERARRFINLQVTARIAVAPVP
jgi:HlyD family secretion protein